MQDLWLLKQASLDVDAVAALKRAWPRLRCWQATDGALNYLYLPGDESPERTASPDWIRLECIQEVEGASPGDMPRFHYVVETDVLPEAEQDLNAWYGEEHLPGLAAVPGVVRAARYVDAHGSPRYYACYDLARLEAFGSPPWLAVRATPWSSRVRPSFRNTSRTMFRVPGGSAC